jgi:predicted transcriptional regulator
MGRPFPQLDVDSEIDRVYKQFKLGSNMVILTKEGKACAVLTKFDIVSHLKASSNIDAHAVKTKGPKISV